MIRILPWAREYEPFDMQYIFAIVDCPGNLLECGDVQVSGETAVIIIGSRNVSASVIAIENSQVHIILDGLSMLGDLTGLRIVGSNVGIQVETASHVLSTGEGRAGIACDGGSNITIFSSSDSVLHLAGGYYAPGIGSVGSCGLLRFLNGSYISKGGDGGAGFGLGASALRPTLGDLVFEGGQFRALSVQF